MSIVALQFIYPDVVFLNIVHVFRALHTHTNINESNIMHLGVVLLQYHFMLLKSPVGFAPFWSIIGDVRDTRDA